jgi:hypothetical protein
MNKNSKTVYVAIRLDQVVRSSYNKNDVLNYCAKYMMDHLRNYNDEVVLNIKQLIAQEDIQEALVRYNYSEYQGWLGYRRLYFQEIEVK